MHAFAARAMVVVFLAPGCADDRPHKPPNLLVLLTDDQGVDKVGIYAAHPSPPPTPNIDALARRGVLFRRAYAQPTCSPTRAALLTGRYNRRYGLGVVIEPLDEVFELPLSEVTAPEALAAAGYHSEVL